MQLYTIYNNTLKYHITLVYTKGKVVIWHWQNIWQVKTKAHIQHKQLQKIMSEQVNYAFFQMQIKNWPYKLFISPVSSCQLCCNRILSSRLHKTQCQGPLMVPLWPIRLLSIQLWNSSLVRECDKSVSQLLGARFCVTRVSGSKGNAQSPSSMSQTEPESVVPIGLQLKMGGKPDLCMSAKTDYRTGQWGQWDSGAFDCQELPERLKPGNKPLQCKTDTDRRKSAWLCASDYCHVVK